MTEFRSTRRTFLAAVPAIALSACARNSRADRLVTALAELETANGGRLGACLYLPDSDAVYGHRVDERFGMCSTFKTLLAGLILREADLDRLQLQQFVPYDEADLVPYAPVTEKHLADGGMSVVALAEATQTTSDNVAANLLLQLIDGPQGFTRRLRELGDDATRLDRYEPEMNLVPAGEVRDTTTPAAMSRSLSRFVVGDVLSVDSRALLTRWLIETRTGMRRIRAGLPETWVAGDKTGTGIAESMANKYNDVAVTWPNDNEVAVIAAYYEADGYYANMRDKDQAVLAEVGRLAAVYLAS